jgi:hypothetical protein
MGQAAVSKSLGQYAREIQSLIITGDAVAEADPKVRRHAINVGEYLIEARCQMPHDEFMAWARRNFKMKPKAAERYMDIAYRARRESRHD